MNRCKLYETVALFLLSNLYLKQGISKVYVVVDFFARVYSSCEECQSIENCKMKNSCPQWVSYLVPSAYEANALTIALQDLISN